MTKLVFLGGTAANNKWRDGFIERLVAQGVKKEQLFDPVVADWNDAAVKREEEAKRNASYHLYYLADPQQEGNPLSAYSMVEAAIGLAKRPKTTVIVFDTTGISGHAAKAMKQTGARFREEYPKANIFSTPKDAEDWLVAQLTRSFFGRLLAA